MSTYEEWRVTGRWGEVPYEFVWSPFRNGRTEPEAEARNFVEKTQEHGWTDGPHLHTRTVTVTDWTEVDA